MSAFRDHGDGSEVVEIVFDNDVGRGYSAESSPRSCRSPVGVAGCGSTTGGMMHAKPGDRIVIETTTLDAQRRSGDVIEVIGQGEREHYRVRWLDGHESVFFPGPDAHVVSPS